MPLLWQCGLLTIFWEQITASNHLSLLKTHARILRAASRSHYRRIMMKKVVLTCLASLALSFGISSNAMADIKVGIVDMKGAIEKTESDGVLKKLKTEAETRQKKLEASKKKLLAFKQEIEESASVLSQDKLREKAAQYQQQMLDLEKEMQTYQQEMIELETKLLGDVQQKMFTISTAIAKEKSLDLLLERSQGGVVYFQPSFDVTDELIKRYKAAK